MYALGKKYKYDITCYVNSSILIIICIEFENSYILYIKKMK